MKINMLYDVETSLLKALPKVAKAVTEAELRRDITDHLEETKKQAERLEKMHVILGEKPTKFKSEAIEGLIDDTEWVIKRVKPQLSLDAALARSVQTVEHYEIALYLAAFAWAKELAKEDIATYLLESLNEEKEAEGKLDIVGKKLAGLVA